MALQSAPLLLLPDFSEWNAGADMAGVREQNGGAAIIRVAYGAHHDDKVFAKLRKAAIDYRFLGLYGYLVASQPVQAQAERFVQLVGRLRSFEVPVLDCEEGAGSQLSRARAWFAYVDQALGLAPLPLAKRSWQYSGENFAQEHGLTPIVLSGRHAWIAAYGQTEPALGHTLWQCTNGQTGSHITSWPGAGRCDTSLFHGTVAELAHLIDRGQASAARILEDPMLLNKGAKAKTPIALPDGAKSVRFFSNTDAELRVDMRDGKAERDVKLAYSSTRTLDVPAGVHGIVVHRIDGQANDVSAAITT